MADELSLVAAVAQIPHFEKTVRACRYKQTLFKRGKLCIVDSGLAMGILNVHELVLSRLQLVHVPNAHGRVGRADDPFVPTPVKTECFFFQPLQSSNVRRHSTGGNPIELVQVDETLVVDGCD